MTRSAAILLRFIALTPLAFGAVGCKAFSLGPQTEEALAANAASPGYPRLADVPPEPVDVACIRAGLDESLIIAPATRDAMLRAVAPAAQELNTADALAGTNALVNPNATDGPYAGGGDPFPPPAPAIAPAAVAAQPVPAVTPDGGYIVMTRPASVQAPRYNNLLSAAEALAGEAGIGGDGGRKRTPPEFMECPPSPGAYAERLLAERARLEAEGAEIRAARPVAPDADIVLPEGMGRIAPAGAGPEQGR